MKTLKLVIQSRQTKEFLVLGISNSNDETPTKWELPKVQNEYGALNDTDVIKNYISNQLRLELIGIDGIDRETGIAKITVADNTHLRDLLLLWEQDPDDAYEHRKFVSSDDLLKLL